jgi:hypothetical protein
VEEAETGQRPAWKNIANRSRRMYKKQLGPTEIPSCEQWHITVPEGISRQMTKTAQVVLPWNKVNYVLTKLHGRPSGHLSVNKIVDNVWQRYYWLQARNDVEK